MKNMKTGAVPLSVRIGWSTGPYEPNGCRLWTSFRDRFGYGRISVNDQPTLVTRIILGLTVGDGLEACHRCDNPPCVNPAHLYIGTHVDNMRDVVTRGRHHGQTMTECHAGHPFDAENTYRWRNSRICRACARLRKANDYVMRKSR